MSDKDLSQCSLMELFRTEAETQLSLLTNGLLALEKDPSVRAQLEEMMRAAHSMKGAARIVNLGSVVKVAHAMEDCMVAVQKGVLQLQREQVDILLASVDLLARISQTPEPDLGKWETEGKPEVEAHLDKLASVLKGEPVETARPLSAAPAAAVATPIGPAVSNPPTQPEQPAPPPPSPPAPPPAAGASSSPIESGRMDRVLRVKAEHVNRMLGLAGESLVESRWLRPFGESLLRLKSLHSDMERSMAVLRESLSGLFIDERTETAWNASRKCLQDCQELLANRFTELDMFDRRSANLSYRLYHEALACRMRPFADGLNGFPRMVRDVGRRLGKEVRLVLVGEGTQVDRDILEKLEAPLAHLVRNAIDHGLESTADREAVGKPAEGTVRIEARHSAGRLVITVSDDGRGIEIERVRRTVVKRSLTTAETAAVLSEAELLEFLFLPGFSVREEVTEISGRGVGLDVVQSVVKSVRGTIRVTSERGKGTRFQLQLPLTLSVLRTLLVEIAGQPYAFPLAHVLRTVKLPREAVESLEGIQHFRLEGKRVGLVSSHQIFGHPEPATQSGSLCIVVLGETNQRYGLSVDRFLGERELVVQPLDARLGKIKDISSGSIMEDGSPILIVDSEDLIRSIEKLANSRSLHRLEGQGGGDAKRRGKRILVVDDSLTVRELQRKILTARGYEVEVAVDGMDGWNALRDRDFQLLISDIDMPRMDGIELISMVKRDRKLRSVPAMIVSYKDREEDRLRGLEAGADYYLSKGSFHDDTLIRAVGDLIGPAA
ncbi:MAG: hybrid sensor histidine kinase/response regulator [Verrucomicrobiales bacterium]|nr:hybrid sensor histidine kinase/response regulator [Verrucomicrobiales bacterium]